MIESAQPDRGILLLSLPWRVAGWPSTSLGALKAYLAANGVEIAVRHLHMEIACTLGLDRYDTISDRAWDLGEALYSCLLAPDERDRLLEPIIEALRKRDMKDLADWAATSAVEDVRALTEAALAATDLDRYWMVGITIGALQLSSSLYTAQLLRRRAPHLHILLGGAGVVGEVGRNLLAVEPAVDAIVDGEGEETLLTLARLGAPLDEERLATVPNLWYRSAGGEVRHAFPRLLTDLDRTAVPDYSDYFNVAESAGYPPSAMILPVEASRGCAWEHRCGPDELRGCTFCGLFRTSPDYREKSLPRLIHEIDDLIQRSQRLDLAFVDAYLPDSYRRELLANLGDGSRDLTVWCEMRCNFDDEIAALLAGAGVWKVQLGVESFHTGILKRIEKGARAIDNVYAIRLCEENGIQAQYNLITHYPGVPGHEVEEMIQIIPLLFGYRPPGLTDFYLDRGSRVYLSPDRYGLTPEDLDHLPTAYLPSRLANRKVSQVVPFRIEAIGERAIAAWEELGVIVARWQEFYRNATRAGIALPLSFREGSDFIEITDCRSGDRRTLTIGGSLRDIFLICRRPTSKSKIEQQLPHLSPARIERLLQALASQGLIFQEGPLNLSLPARATLPSGAPRAMTSTPRSLVAPLRASPPS
jgi:ribosomal peptide maturation radical SAM protein 1